MYGYEKIAAIKKFFEFTQKRSVQYQMLNEAQVLLISLEYELCGFTLTLEAEVNREKGALAEEMPP